MRKEKKIVSKPDYYSSKGYYSSKDYYSSKTLNRLLIKSA